MAKKWFRDAGPGALVAAAFIGPGTVTLCTLAGVNFGMHLLWAMLLSIIATVVLQEMAARLGVISQKGLSEVIREEIKHPFFKKIIVALVLTAVVVGNAAYEAGNISGGILGLEAVFGKLALDSGGLSINLMSVLIGIVAFTLLYIGNYRFWEKALVALVLLMSFSFVITAIITRPNLSDIVSGIFIPRFPEGSLLTVVGLVGTTVVPYNLFLHASLVKEKWKSAAGLSAARKDTILSIVGGGLVSMAVIVSAVAVPGQEIGSAADLAKSLVPLYGESAQYCLALGLFAAGITSAITAPLAAAYVAQGCLGWSAGLKSKRFRAVWMLILGLGVLFSSLGIKPIEVIKLAQIANGMLLPIIVGILLWIMNKRALLGAFSNTKLQNAVGLFILIISIFLGLKSILTVLNFI